MSKKIFPKVYSLIPKHPRIIRREDFDFFRTFEIYKRYIVFNYFRMRKQLMLLNKVELKYISNIDYKINYSFKNNDKKINFKDKNILNDDSLVVTIDMIES